MSLQTQQLASLSRRVIHARSRELKETEKLGKFWWWLQKWFWMLCHEYLRDGVTIRAQSLSFLMLFSILPLIAGAFFIFTFLAQFGMVQDAIQGLVDNVLSNIPSEHRDLLNSYIIQFKDMYLANITRTSRSVGIFALFILGWVGLQSFNNIESTLNFIWSSDQERPFFEKIRNFIVVVVIGPIMLIGGSSVPLILHRFAVTRFLFERIPLLGVLLNYVVPASLILATFFTMYRFVPVRRVWGKSALAGAIFATAGVAITHLIMRIYFAYGTNTAYGKVAAIPLVGFWIYAIWIVIILGAEVSFLVQNGKDIFVESDREPALREGEGLLTVLAELYRSYKKGNGPLSFEKLRDATDLSSGKTRCVLEFLASQKLIAECMGDPKQPGDTFTLAQDVSELDIGELLKTYFIGSGRSSLAAVDKAWKKSLDHWLSFFHSLSIPDLAK